MRRRCIFAILLLLLLTLTRAAAAADVDAATKKAATAEAAKATKALAAQSFKAAAEGFESAFAKMPNVTWLFNAASARQRNGDVVSAANEYARFLNEAPEKDKNREPAKKELANLGSMLGRIEVKADGATQITVDGQPASAAGVSPFYVLAGAHTIEAHFGDKVATESPTTIAGQLSTVVLSKTGSSGAAAPDEPKQEAAAIPAPADTAAVKVEPTAHRPKPLPPLVVWIGGGATVVLGGLTVFSGLDVVSKKNSFDQDRSQANLDSGKGKELRTNILLISTGVVGVLTAVAAIWFVDWRSFTEPQAAPPKSGSLTTRLLRGTF